MAKISGNGVPTKNLVGAIGDIYTDLNTGRKYECVEALTKKTYNKETVNYQWDFIEEYEPYIGEGGGGSWDTLKDKPFYEETREVICLPETVVSCENSDLVEGKFTHFFDSEIELNNNLYVGNEYTIVYDGKEYKGVLEYTEDGNHIGINMYASSSPTDLPFGLYFGHGHATSELSAVVVNDALEHTFEIRGSITDVKKLDSKYYTTVFYADYYNKPCKDKSLTQQVTPEELVNAAENSMVILKYIHDDGFMSIYPLTHCTESEGSVSVSFSSEHSYSFYK